MSNSQSAFQNGGSENFNGIDLVKFLCAVLVCMIHVKPFPDTLRHAEILNFALQNCLCRIAVPFFFVSSGFFLFRKMEPAQLDKERVRNYCFKILRLLGIWTVLLHIGSTVHLWYLGATVIAILAVSVLFQRRVKYSAVAIMGAVLYVLGLLGDSYYGLLRPLKDVSVFAYAIKGYESLFVTTRNGIFMGFIFVFMGASFARGNVRVNAKMSAVGFVLSAALLLAEAFVLRQYQMQKDHNMYICLLPATFFLFSAAMQLKLKDRRIYSRLRIIGVIFFFVHLLVSLYVRSGIHAVKKLAGIDLAPYLFLLVAFISLLIGALVEYLSRKEAFRWLRWLYA